MHEFVILDVIYLYIKSCIIFLRAVCTWPLRRPDEKNNTALVPSKKLKHEPFSCLLWPQWTRWDWPWVQPKNPVGDQCRSRWIGTLWPAQSVVIARGIFLSSQACYRPEQGHHRTTPWHEALARKILPLCYGLEIFWIGLPRMDGETPNELNLYHHINLSNSDILLWI